MNLRKIVRESTNLGIFQIIHRSSIVNLIMIDLTLKIVFKEKTLDHHQ